MRPYSRLTFDGIRVRQSLNGRSGPGLVIEATSTIGVPFDVANQPSAALRALHPVDGELVAGLASGDRGLNRPPHCGQRG
jgi:hypothetical protein